MTAAQGTPSPLFSARLWASTEPVYEAILRHPFLTGLTDGTLPRAAFAHFVIQDAHYLRDYARALAVCAAKAPTEDDVRALANDAAEAVAAEQAMHVDLLDALGGPAPGDPAPGGTPPGGVATVAPTTRAYTSYLLATVYGGSFLEGLAAVLPCYWIYARVGARLLADSSPDPVYARWIAAYGDPAFQAVADRVVALTDRVGAFASEPELVRAADHFAVTARYEWMFWDAAWRRETWPI
ncbi:MULTISPECIES: thiaminase II [Frankia]|uniref:Aminopyrimidine aminohydrolase n=1 Tax=Frankia alni (strain DSM 45986 / CECT 9034 / ACN14a) TaxID=326424 RepID=Q0RQG4_FRAAA|nr:MULTISPECIES: thiaminase II [Frankia]CAJ60211.1 putative TenA family transcriptional activator [Frankia alni ACN14a]